MILLSSIILIYPTSITHPISLYTHYDIIIIFSLSYYYY